MHVNGRSHAKCLGLNKIGFKYYKDYQDRMWTCGLCSLPFRSESYLSNEMCELENTMTMTNTQTSMEGIEEIYANSGEGEDINMQDSQRHSIFEERQINSSGAFIMHLNINGLQNKYDELKLLNDTLKAHIIVISETRIDRYV